MIYYAFQIREGRTVETFDTRKHSEGEFQTFKKKYTGPKGFCIMSVRKVKKS